MDPCTVFTTCVALLAAVAQLSLQVSQFVSGVRDARRDMDAVSRELASLTLCMETLRDDWRTIKYPEGLQQNLIAVLTNCDAVTKDMVQLLNKLSSANLSQRIQWNTTGRDATNKLRSSLETHKSALDIAIEMKTVLMMSMVKEDREDIRANADAIEQDAALTPKIKQDTSGLIKEIGILHIQVTELQKQDSRGGVLLQRFLDELTAYAETIGETQDLDRRQASSDTTEFPVEDRLVDEEEQEISPVTPKTVQFNDVQSAVDQETDPSAIPENPPRSYENLESVKAPPASSGLSGTHDIIQDAPAAIAEASIDVDTIRARATPSNDRGLLRSDQRHSYRLRPVSGETLPGCIRKQVDQKAIDAAGIARQRLSLKKRAKLDKNFATLIMGKKSFKDRIKNRSMWTGPNIGSFSDIKQALDLGARMEVSHSDALTIEVTRRSDTRPDVVDLLLSRGADVTENAPIYTLSRSGRQSSLIKVLLEYGVDPDKIFKGFGESALYRSAAAGDIEGVRLLIAYGAHVNMRDHSYKALHGYALHVACFEAIAYATGDQPGPPYLKIFRGVDVGRFEAYVDTVRVLLEYGADPDITFWRYNHTAAMEAIEKWRGMARRLLPDQRKEVFDRVKVILSLLKQHGAFDEQIAVYLDMSQEEWEQAMCERKKVRRGVSWLRT